MIRSASKVAFPFCYFAVRFRRFDRARDNILFARVFFFLRTADSAMDNDAGNSPSSGPSPPAMIMAPPPPPPRPDGDCSGTGAGLENPSGVRNLKDILKLTTEMSANVPADENAAAGGTVDAEVSAKQLLFLNWFRTGRKCTLLGVLGNVSVSYYTFEGRCPKMSST